MRIEYKLKWCLVKVLKGKSYVYLSRLCYRFKIWSKRSEFFFYILLLVFRLKTIWIMAKNSVRNYLIASYGWQYDQLTLELNSRKVISIENNYSFFFIYLTDVHFFDTYLLDNSFLDDISLNNKFKILLLFQYVHNLWRKISKISK